MSDVIAAAHVMDMETVVRLLRDRVPLGVTTFDDALDLLPSLRESVSPGIGNAGRMAFTLIHRDPASRSLISLAAMERCLAPAHLHVGQPGKFGEVTVTLGGELVERLYQGGERRSQREPNISLDVRWDAGSIHQPLTETIWFGVYLQPGGSKLLANLTADQLLGPLQKAVGESSLWKPAGWDDMDNDEARQTVAEMMRFKL